MSIFTIAFAAFVGLAAGNFTYQAMTGKKQYAVAFDRTFFQAVACAFVAILAKVLP